MNKIYKMVFVAPGVHGDLMRHAESAYPAECCGVLRGRAVREGVEFFDLLVGANIALANQGRRFQMDWATLLQGIKYWSASPDHVIAHYHSHTNGSVQLSELDGKNIWTEFPQVIIPVLDGRAQRPVLWTPLDEFIESGLRNRRNLRTLHFLSVDCTDYADGESVGSGIEGEHELPFTHLTPREHLGF